jgi:excinuclease UvrABC nuclease subunit
VEAWSIQRLLDAGFSLVGQCVLDAEGFSYSAAAPTDPGVYAFTVDGLVCYIGLTRFGLRTRLGHYVYGHAAQKTSARVKGLILDALSNGQRVEVLIAQPPTLRWNGLPVDGPAGLETGLIKLIKPKWNLQGNR